MAGANVWLALVIQTRLLLATDVPCDPLTEKVDKPFVNRCLK